MATLGKKATCPLPRAKAGQQAARQKATGKRKRASMKRARQKAHAKLTK